MYCIFLLRGEFTFFFSWQLIKHWCSNHLKVISGLKLVETRYHSLHKLFYFCFGLATKLWHTKFPTIYRESFIVSQHFCLLESKYLHSFYFYKTLKNFNYLLSISLPCFIIIKLLWKGDIQYWFTFVSLHILPKSCHHILHWLFHFVFIYLYISENLIRFTSCCPWEF